MLVEKPAGLSAAQIDTIDDAAQAAGRRVKVGFNHRFHPGIHRAITEARSGVHGDVLHVRGRYGHGGRIGYDQEWRADVQRSGGGEIVDQGMHLLDLTHWLLGPLPLHSALLRTQFWDTEVDDNAALILGERALAHRAVGDCCTSPGPSGRTSSRWRSTAARPSCTSRASCAPTGRRSCGSSR